jgi:phosphatidylglycerophosphate synthase
MSDRPLTEGEQWARDELAQLLARRFTLPAVARFLWSSSVRSAQIRRSRPELARRAWSWAGLGAGAWVALAVAGRQPFKRRLKTGLGWWALTSAMVDWHLGMVETKDGRPRNLSTADFLTLARAWLVPVALDAPTPLVCVLASVTDTLDGPLARRAGPTRAGRDLEGLVDACFGAAALRGARRRGWLGRRVVAAELTRLATGLTYALVVYFGRSRPPAEGVVHAARTTSALRVGGLLLAGVGRRREADVLMLTGSAASVGLVARAAYSEWPSRVPRPIREPGTR